MTGSGEKRPSTKHVDTFTERYSGFQQELKKIGKARGNVHHSIEMQVLKLFKKIFTVDELNKIESLRGIFRKHNVRLHLSFIRMLWNRYYDRVKEKLNQIKNPGQISTIGEISEDIYVGNSIKDEVSEYKKNAQKKLVELSVANKGNLFHKIQEVKSVLKKDALMCSVKDFFKKVVRDRTVINGDGKYEISGIKTDVNQKTKNLLSGLRRLRVLSLYKEYKKICMSERPNFNNETFKRILTKLGISPKNPTVCPEEKKRRLGIYFKFKLRKFEVLKSPECNYIAIENNRRDFKRLLSDESKDVAFPILQAKMESLDKTIDDADIKGFMEQFKIKELNSEKIKLLMRKLKVYGAIKPIKRKAKQDALKLEVSILHREGDCDSINKLIRRDVSYARDKIDYLCGDLFYNPISPNIDKQTALREFCGL
ncbi:MAG: hypothetical protein C0412_19775 [Flavobacterium sp.]|nr:hypothetical protein [Flavobacterium sp.]